MDPNKDPVLETARGIAELFHPERLLLFSRKAGLDGAVTSFKLCMVAAVEDKREAPRRIYRRAEGEVPFEVLLYTPREWADALARPDSFARRIERMGRDLLG